MGRVNGHPLLRDDARTRTSPVLRISEDGSWARSFSRVYALGCHDLSLFREMKSDGVLPNLTKLLQKED